MYRKLNDVLIASAENVPKVYDSGHKVGFEEGKIAERDAFWDEFQKKGDSAGAYYYYAFAYTKWTDTNYNPKYPIIISESTLSGRNVFQATSITDTKVPIYANSMTALMCFYDAENLKRIRYFEVKESTAYDRTFSKSANIEELIMGGTIGKNGFDVSECKKLNKASIESIINALSTTTSGLTVTLSQTAVNNAFTAEEWDALEATKTNWTISLV